jgi:hypothetical protein
MTRAPLALLLATLTFYLSRIATSFQTLNISTLQNPLRGIGRKTPIYSR